ncbi:hypothetical protein LK994_02105 [Ferruginibacter lapsinanis]|uniref:Wzz/FepE/Etk N-terminal domain-containing protein n=1 Tax=Ferruginibacter lapsinanis TaxID=563172 RepID=UPI001E578FBC|nr:Wzz/FepE/Etk N-terminal domain-containing protein [Ferruginibacter lapsinanis]UEG50266.1 hypothetical protein LK994_02105 [Ferruginibacter lapsinanis]
MDTAELTRALFIRLGKSKMLILLTAGIFAVLLFFYAYTSKPSYTSKASVFPLTNPTESALSGGGLSSLLGMNGSAQSFSSDASINIIELALSRNVREAVASTRLPNRDNRTIAELLINEKNKQSGLFSSKSNVPTDSVSLATVGGSMLKNAIDAKINKNGVLELNFTSTDESLVKPVTEVLISKISQFYINLRIQKASADYDFIVKKIDSLNGVVGIYDKRAIGMQNSTFFTPDRLEYSLPKENLTEDKERIKAQRNAAISNRDEALWRLQKVTPIIATLDKPDPPFAVDKKSEIVWAILGFILGAILAAVFSVSGLLYKYVKAEIHRSVFGTAA